jgi:hypothetical protein
MGSREVTVETVTIMEEDSRNVEIVTGKVDVAGHLEVEVEEVYYLMPLKYDLDSYNNFSLVRQNLGNFVITIVWYQKRDYSALSGIFPVFWEHNPYP